MKMLIIPILFILAIKDSHSKNTRFLSASYDELNRFHLGYHLNSNSIYLRPVVNNNITYFDLRQEDQYGLRIGLKHHFMVASYKELKISAVPNLGYGLLFINTTDTYNQEVNYYQNTIELGIQPEIRYQNFAIFLQSFQWEYNYNKYTNDSETFTYLHIPNLTLINLEIGLRFYLSLN